MAINSPSHVVSISALLILFTLLISPSCQADNILYSGENLNTEESLDYGSYTFKMQQDCNLVLYDYGIPIWASNTGGVASGCYCSMQPDGNLVVYEQTGHPIWASNTGRDNGYYVLILQKDRNVVIYGTATWSTATNAVNAGKGGRVIKVVDFNYANSTTNVYSG